MQFLTIALLCINIVVAALLTGAVLLQKSEGGALGMGGGGGGNFMSARGTGDLLTRITWILFGIFLVISISLTLIGAATRAPTPGSNLKIDPNSIQSKPSDLLKTAPAPAGGSFDPNIGAAPAPAAPAGNGLLPAAPAGEPEKK